MTEKKNAIAELLGSPEMKAFVEGGEPLTEEERLDLDAYNYAKDLIHAGELAKEYDPAERALPVKDAGVDYPDSGEVWVWNSEVWGDGDPSVGWHRTYMVGGYGKGSDAYCNWWGDPVGGRIGNNPYWLPGDVPREELPDMVPLLANLDRLDSEARARAREKLPPFEGRRPPFSRIFMEALPIMRLMNEKEAAEEAEKREARNEEIKKIAEEKYLKND